MSRLALALLLPALACSNLAAPSESNEPSSAGDVSQANGAPVTEDNPELLQLVEADQADREIETDDWGPIAARDQQRRERVLALDQAGALRTANDFAHAALIFQHGQDPADYERAHAYADRAHALDPQHGLAAWLWAATKDRWLHSKGEPQIYGTQHRMGEDGRWTLEPFDREAVSDEERAALGVPSLAEAEAANDLHNLQGAFRK
ncbi:MAG: hypothetical protein KC431_23395, partial [Myxococcales bacterium]|nr:hypothetical protein [Myxococcales bacterium]